MWIVWLATDFLITYHSGLLVCSVRGGKKSLSIYNHGPSSVDQRFQFVLVVARGASDPGNASAAIDGWPNRDLWFWFDGCGNDQQRVTSRRIIKNLRIQCSELKSWERDGDRQTKRRVCVIPGFPNPGDNFSVGKDYVCAKPSNWII